MQLAEAWANFRSKRKGGRKGHRKGKGKGKSAFPAEEEPWDEQEAYPAENQRNLSQEIPTGWDPKKWLDRTPCTSCGSRWHRSCAAHGKGKGKPKGGKGFAMFLMNACMLSAVSAVNFSTALSDTMHMPNTMTHFPCKVLAQMSEYALFPLERNQLVSFSAHDDFFHDCVSEGISEANVEDFVFYECHEYPCSSELTTVSNTTSSKQCNSSAQQFIMPVEVPFFAHAFPASHLHSCSETWRMFVTDGPSDVFVGMEPLDAEMRESRFKMFSINSRVRYAIMLDSGAPRSASGMRWMNRFVKEFELENECLWERYRAQLSGIGEGSASVNWRITVPVGLENFPPTSWQCQLLEGCGEFVPPLLGLESMERVNAVINIAKKLYIVDAPDGSRVELQCKVVGGHLMLPVDWGGKPQTPDRTKYLADPLGINVWFNQTAASNTTLPINPVPPVTSSVDRHWPPAISARLPQVSEQPPEYKTLQFSNNTAQHPAGFDFEEPRQLFFSGSQKSNPAQTPTTTQIEQPPGLETTSQVMPVGQSKI
jgi:hypothetical protein